MICKDDVREAALRHDAQVMSDLRENFSEQASKVRVDSNDMTYEAMFAVGLTQLRVGAKGVVLESPLGRVTLGERAVAITKEAQALCILVDCYAERSVWEKRLKERQRAASNGTTTDSDKGVEDEKLKIGSCNTDNYKPSDPDQIVRHYTNMHYKIDCDAHVSIDCGLPAEHNVNSIECVIKQLLAEES